MKNNYEVRGEVTAIFINSPKHGVTETLISTNKLEKAKEYKNTWGVKKEISGYFYVYGHLPRDTGEKGKVILHRYLTDAPKGMEVDHINHNTLDNTDENLRVLTVSENQQNRKGASTNSKSGILGVCWDKYAKSWKVQLIVYGEIVYFGNYKDLSVAKSVAIESRKKYLPFSQIAN